MVTKFQLIDSEGKVLADGEIENGIYRVFSFRPNSLTDTQNLENLEDMYATVWGQRDTA